MNEYHAIARKYFRQVEGWHLYRTQGDGLRWLWLALAVFWIASFVPLARSIGDWVMFAAWLAGVLVLELVVLFIGSRILDRKRAALIAEVTKEYSVVLKDEQECRVFLLTKLLEGPTNGFFAVAKEISDLLKLRQEFRGRNEIEFEFYWRMIYDRDSKARLTAVTLAAITVFTALTIRALPEGASIFDILANQPLLSRLGDVVMVSAVLFLMLVGARALLGVVWHAVTIWGAKSLTSKESSTVLHYLARDLILLHKPVEVKDAEGGRSAAIFDERPDAAERSSPSLVKPGVLSRGFQIAAVCAVILDRVLDDRRRRRSTRS
jgi:hypothetical protein